MQKPKMFCSQKSELEQVCFIASELVESQLTEWVSLRDRSIDQSKPTLQSRTSNRGCLLIMSSL